MTARPTIIVRYTGNANAADDLATPAPTNGIINYPDHIQPIWTRSRGVGGVNTCTNCHNDTVKLDLRATVAGSGRLVSYDELLLGDPMIDQGTGLPVTRLEDGVPVVVRDAALVENMAGSAEGMTRSSRLGEIIFGEQLKASAGARTAHPNPPASAPDHSTLSTPRKSAWLPSGWTSAASTSTTSRRATARRAPRPHSRARVRCERVSGDQRTA